MKPEPVFHALFWQDVQEASEFLDSRRAGTGAKFSAAVERELAQVVDRPESYRVMFEQVRRALIQKYQYVILFELWPEGVYFYGVIHGMRDVETWFEMRLRG